LIISASRRTDIPAYYSEWMLNRIKDRYVYVRNPMNIHQISRINLNPEVVDCIIFWSKNPKPILDKLQFLGDYVYYFQYTLNPYDNDIEKTLPDKNELIETFKKLSDKTGPQKIIWRYDPVLLNNKYTISYHINKFNDYAYNLKDYTEKVTFSYIDFYKKINQNIKSLGILGITDDEKITIARSFAQIARENNLLIDTCAENIDLSNFNIDHARCIDDRLIARISGFNVDVQKDKNQRSEFGCMGSIDIGEYNTCSNNCIYCYANHNYSIVKNNVKKHNQFSSLLTGDLESTDIINERKIFSNKK